MAERELISNLVRIRVGFGADPGPLTKIDEKLVAQIRVRELEAYSQDLQRELEITNLRINAIREQYKIR